jgi:hypothetical protein
LENDKSISDIMSLIEYRLNKFKEIINDIQTKFINEWNENVKKFNKKI